MLYEFFLKNFKKQILNDFNENKKRIMKDTELCKELEEYYGDVKLSDEVNIYESEAIEIIVGNIQDYFETCWHYYISRDSLYFDLIDLLKEEGCLNENDNNWLLRIFKFRKKS